MEGCRRGRATRKVLCRGAPELAGFTRAVTKHLLSLAAAPRSRLQARLLLVCYCLFFHRLLSSSFSFSSCSMHLPPRWAGALPLRSFWYRAASIWKRVPIVRRADLPACVYVFSRVYCAYSPKDTVDIHFVKIPRCSRV